MITFITSATVSAPRSRVEKGAPSLKTQFPIRYAIFDHPRLGPILVDTGYTSRLFTTPDWRLPVYRQLLRPKLIPDTEPLAELARRGIPVSEVRHILVSHLHADHICGLCDFPDAIIHISSTVLHDLKSRGPISAARHGLFHSLLPHDLLDRAIPFETAPPTALPMGLGSGFDIFSDGLCMAVPLPGHMTGHCGVFWPTGPRGLLYAVDAAWTSPQYRSAALPPWPLSDVLDDRQAALLSATRIHDFEMAGGRVVLCHDPEPV